MASVQRGKGEGSIFRDGTSGLWTGKVELPPGPDGKRRRKVVRRKDKQALVTEMRRLRAELDKAGDLPTSTQTLEQWMTYWLDRVAAKRVRPNVLASYRSVVRAHIIPTLGRTRLDKLTPAHIVRLREGMLDKGLSSTYALGAHRVLSKALEDALREGRIGRNPAKLTDAPRKARTDLATLTLDEAVDVVARAVPALLATPYDPTPVRFAAYVLTGLRRGEMLGLEVDRVGESIDLSWQMQRIKDIGSAPADYEYRHLRGGLYLTRPKSRAGWRMIPVVEPLESLLLEHIARMTPNSYGLMFATPEGEPIDPRREWDLWREYLAEVGVQKNVRLHDVRHTTVDLLYEAGVDEDIITEIIGHSTRAMTRAYKARGNDTRTRGAMLQLSAHLAATPRP